MEYVEPSDGAMHGTSTLLWNLMNQVRPSNAWKVNTAMKLGNQVTVQCMESQHCYRIESSRVFKRNQQQRCL